MIIDAEGQIFEYYNPMNILVLNCGSSSVKFQIIATDEARAARNRDECLAKGVVERIGSLALISFEVNGRPPLKEDAPIRDYREAVKRIAEWLESPQSQIQGIRSLSDIHAIGHRVVHGGEKFKSSIIIDKAVEDGISDCIDLAPLHNPANLKGIRAAREIFGPTVLQVAVFDTAFHSTMPEISYLYPIPYHFYRRLKIRRYGFHGISHQYIAMRYQSLAGVSPQETDIISLHLGNGSSVCAIKGGKSFDTSMGFTPLEGLAMGTRSGDIDPSIIEYISHKEGMSITDIVAMLNRESGLLGISGITSDMRELLDEEKESHDRRAHLAIDIFCLRARHYIGAYLAEMGGAKAVIFTGGIGANSPQIRERICAGLEPLGLSLDSRKNSAESSEERLISASESRIEAYVIAANEELVIARDVCRLAGSEMPHRRSEKM